MALYCEEHSGTMEGLTTTPVSCPSCKIESLRVELAEAKDEAYQNGVVWGEQIVKHTDAVGVIETQLRNAIARAKKAERELAMSRKATDVVVERRTTLSEENDKLRVKIVELGWALSYAIMIGEESDE